VRRAARKALTVASVALVGGAAVGAAIAAVMSNDDATPAGTAGTRSDSVALSGARPAGVRTPGTGNSVAAKAATGGATFAESTRAAAIRRTPAGTTPRGSTTVANRARSDTSGARPAEVRRPPGVSPSQIPAPIRRFVAAVESGDVTQIKQAYPNLSPSEQKAWETVFKQSKPDGAEIREVRGVPSNEPGITVVEFVMAVKFSDRTTKVTTFGRPSRYRARLKREGPNVVLLSLADVAPRR
jgi:hypothetical protein